MVVVTAAAAAVVVVVVVVVVVIVDKIANLDGTLAEDPHLGARKRRAIRGRRSLAVVTV